MRALVVDDDAGVLRALKAVLEKRGWEVRAAENPTQASLPALSGQTCPMDRPCYDLIISDVNMPHMTGIEFLSGLRRGSCWCRNTLLISGQCSPQDVKDAETHGLDLLPKPVNLVELNRRLDEVEQAVAACG